MALTVVTKKSPKKKGQKFPTPGPNSLSYNGPIRITPEKSDTHTQTISMNFTGTVASNGSGVIDSSYSSDPSTYSLTDWTNLAALYHQYRTLGILVKFHPYNRYTHTNVCTPVIALVDRGSAGTMGSYQVAMSHESAKIVSWEDPWSISARMNGPEESQFLSVSGPQALFWIKFYSDGLSVSTTYGRFFVYVLLEMRGRF